MSELLYKHLKLRLKGSPEKIKLFHAFMREMDKDWPTKESHVAGACARCGGIFYLRPLLDARDIKAAGRQVGLRKVTVLSFLPESVCLKKGRIYGTPFIAGSAAA